MEQALAAASRDVLGDQASPDELRKTCLHSFSIATIALLRCERGAAPPAQALHSARAEVVSAWRLIHENGAWNEVGGLQDAAMDLMSLYLRVACRAKGVAARRAMP